MRTDRLIILGGVLLIVFFVVFSAKDMPVVSSGDYTYMSGLNWYNSVEKGMEESISTGKPVLVYFWAAWCKYCKKLEEETFVDPEVNRILKEDFVLVAINVDDQGGVASNFGVGAPPAEIFLRSNGEEITRIPGYIGADTFLSVLQQVREA
jgi:thioredoxin-related protein